MVGVACAYADQSEMHVKVPTKKGAQVACAPKLV
jgi:hypothetical protein